MASGWPDLDLEDCAAAPGGRGPQRRGPHQHQVETSGEHLPHQVAVDLDAEEPHQPQVVNPTHGQRHQVDVDFGGRGRTRRTRWSPEPEGPATARRVNASPRPSCAPRDRRRTARHLEWQASGRDCGAVVPPQSSGTSAIQETET